MFKIFRKKKLKITDCLDYLKKNIDVKFHLNFLRNDLMEIQVYNQSFNKNNKSIPIDNEIGLTILFTFSKLTIDVENCLRKFKNSDYYKNSLNFSLQYDNDRYAYNIDFDINKLNSILRFFTEEIYAYSNSTKNIMEFYIFKENGEILNVEYKKDLPSS